MNCLLACLALAAAPPPPDPAWLSFAVDRRARVTWAFRPASVVKFSGQVRAQVRRATYDAYDVVIPQADCRKGQQTGRIELSRPGFISSATWVRNDGSLAWEMARTICGYSRRPW